MPGSVQIARVAAVTLLLNGCHSKQLGDCDESGLSSDHELEVTTLNVGNDDGPGASCHSIPDRSCQNTDGLRCLLDDSDEAYRFGAIVVSSDVGYLALLEQWAALAELVPEDRVSDWSSTTLVFATLYATASSEADMSYDLQVHADGTPHVVVDFSHVYDRMCDCAVSQCLGLMIEGGTGVSTVCVNSDRE